MASMGSRSSGEPFDRNMNFLIATTATKGHHRARHSARLTKASPPVITTAAVLYLCTFCVGRVLGSL